MISAASQSHTIRQPHSFWVRTCSALLLPVYLNLAFAVGPWGLLAAPVYASEPSAETVVSPFPVYTPKTVSVNRRLPSNVSELPSDVPFVFSAETSDAELFRARVLAEPFVPAGGMVTKGENQAFAKAIKTYQRQDNSDDLSSFTSFLSAYPQSRWAASVQLNLGLRYFQTAYFSRALAAYAAAWSLSKDAPDTGARAVADRAIGELMQLNARLGRADVLKQFDAELAGRMLQGSSSELIAGARAGLWLMENRPGDAFRCGPGALDRILAHQQGSVGFNEILLAARSTEQGISLAQVKQLAKSVGLDWQVAKRKPGAVVITPAVVHWQVNHYAALLTKTNGTYYIEDPTFGPAYTATRKALDAEASGYFLVSAGALPEGWSAVTDAEASTIWGKGNTTANDPAATRPTDDKCPPCPPQTTGGVPAARGMPVAAAHVMTVSLNLVDAPLGYTPPIGPAVVFKLTYNQREAGQPSTFDYGHVGRKWSHDWLSFIDESRAGSTGSYTFTPTVRVAGGGSEKYSASSVSTTADLAAYTFPNQAETRVQLSKLDASTYQQLNPDGSRLIFGYRTGAAGARRYFLTQLIDSSGNGLTFDYDTSSRLVAVTDALGQVTTLDYTDPADPLRLTQVTDPFGRFCTLGYTAGGQLASLMDVIGLSSTVSYQAGTDFINILTTPYGTSTFAYGELGRDRWLTMTDAQGDTERIEYRDNSASYPAVAIRPSGINTNGAFHNNRNTFYWDKKAYKEKPTDVNYAYTYHWLHTSINETSSRLEAEKPASEDRIWYNYEGQTSSAYDGTTSRRTKVGRVLDDGTTQLSQYTYNALGRVTQAVDPLNRVTTYIYDTNGIDLLEVRQKTGPNTADYEVLAKATYNTQHLPLTTTDAAGQVTAYTYNAAGQPLSITNAKSETTTFWYHPTGQSVDFDNLSATATGYLVMVDGPLSGTADSIRTTYDGYGRPRTVTESEGYSVTTDYDDFDRPTLVTYLDSTTHQVVYDRLDAIKTKDRLGRWTQTTYNALRQPSIIRDALGRKTFLEYCKCGGLRTLTDANGRVTIWSYDTYGRVTSKNYPDGTATAYSYESKTGRLKTITDAKGQVAIYTYLKDNALDSVAYTGATVATPSVSYSYDTYYPRVLTRIDGVGTTTYTYNPIPITPTLGAGRLASIDGPWANDTQSYTYDELGRGLTSSLNGSANTTTLTYDALGRVSSLVNPLGTFGHTYVGATARPSQRTYPNGQVTNYAYHPNIAATGTGDGDQRLQELEHLAPGGANLSTYGYTYDAEGMIKTWSRQLDTDAALISTFGYDAVNQLTSAVLPSSPTTGTSHLYRYDKGGNRTSLQVDNAVTAAAHNTLNQVTALSATGPIRVAGTLDEPAVVTVNGQPAAVDATNAFSADVSLAPGTHTLSIVATDGSSNTSTKTYEITVGTGTAARTLTYDLNGNLLGDGAGRTFTWDAVNRLASITMGTDVTGFVYDGAGRRVIEKLNGTEIRRWIWGGGPQPIEERDATNAVTKRFYSGLGEQIGGVNYYYTTDHLGSVREMIDDTGAIRARYTYDPFGQKTKVLGDLESTFGFTGFLWHEPSSLNLTIYRGYDTEIGRWLSRDPIAERGGVNLYAYVGNSPVSFYDPLGLRADVNFNDGTTKSAMTADGLYEIINNASNGSISSIAMMGHSSPEMQGISMSDRDGQHVILKTASGRIELSTSNGQWPDFAKLVKDKLSHKGSAAPVINLNGCNTARGDDNIAQALSRQLPGVVVTGSPTATLGKYWGNESSSSWGGPANVYMNGERATRHLGGGESSIYGK